MEETCSVSGQGAITRRRLDRGDLLVAGAAAVAVFAAYLATLPAHITGEDSGEFISAAYSWGVCHPPGYPLYTMLGKLATLAIPFGSIAMRVNMLSSVLGAAAAFFACLLVIRVTSSRIAGWIAGAALGVSRQFWMLAVVAEVYTLQSLLLIVQLLLVDLWAERKAAKYLLGFAFVYGLSLTNHLTAAGLAPVFGLYILAVDGKILKRPGLVAACLALFALGLTPYLLILVRGRTAPAVDWAHVRTVRDLWDHFMRRQYAGVTVGEERSLAVFLGELGAIASYIARQFTWIGAALAASGFLWQHARRRGATAWLWLAVMLTSSVAVSAATNFPVTRPHLSANYQFFLPVNVILALWIGVALASLVRLLQRRRRLALALCVLPFLIFLANRHDCDRRRYFLNEDLAESLVAALDENAIIAGTNDLTNFAVLYRQVVRGRRKDIRFVTLYGPSNFNADLPGAAEAGPRPDPRDAKYRSYRDRNKARLECDKDYGAWQTRAFWGILQRNLDRPIYFAYAETVEHRLPGWTLRPEGFLWRLCRTDDDTWKARDRAAAAKLIFRNFNTDAQAEHLAFDVHRDLNADWIAGHTFYMRGLALSEGGDKNQAARLLMKAHEAATDIRQIQNNAALVLADMGFLSEAAQCFAAAAHADRRSMDYRLRHAVALHKAGRLAEAVSLMDRILRYDRTPPGIIGMIGDTFRLIAAERRAAGDARRAAAFEERARAAYAKAAARSSRSP